jgi:aspartyl-tRNA(Asn)/glutamyl-tRNA(Gln) amidotransferase subunit C
MLERSQIEHLAHLARIELSEEEKKRFSEQLNAILTYIEKISEVDVTGVEPMAHPTALHNVHREDIPGPAGSVDQALANAPAREGVFFKVPQIKEDR